MALDVFNSVTLLFGMSINLYSTFKFDIHSSCVITLTLNRNVYHSLVCIKSSSESELVVWWTGKKEITKLVSAKIMAFSQNLHLVCWTHWQIQSVWRTDFKETWILSFWRQLTVNVSVHVKQPEKTVPIEQCLEVFALCVCVCLMWSSML